MTDGSEKVIGKDSIEERIRIAQANRNRAIETESRWNWYVLTLPWAAIAIILQMDVPINLLERAILLSSFITLAIGAVCGIYSQKHKSAMLYSASEVDLRLAQISSDPDQVAGEKLLDKFEAANDSRERSMEAMKWTLLAQYWMTGIGLVLLGLNYIAAFLPDCG